MDRQRLEREINILKNTFHYNIIKIYQVKETTNTICMIMEYAEGGELFSYIIDQGYLSEDESRNIFQQIIDAIYYLHQIGICHRDLKPENILFDSKEKKRIKIIDFGLSNLYIVGNTKDSINLSLSNKKELLNTPCGSPGYAPPEMILGCKYDGILTDIWSSGIILYAMLCGCLPFDDFSEEKLYSKIIKGNYEYPPMIQISEEVKNLINSILVINPKQRANINDIKNNKWFKKNYKPTLGIFISISEIPVSNVIVKEMKKRGYDEKKIIDYIKNNNHNSLTIIYYLLVKQKLKKGIGTESDMISNVFQKYIKEQIMKNEKENIQPICLKQVLMNYKSNMSKNKDNKNDKDEKELKNTNKDKKDKDNINENKESNSNKKESKNKERKNKSRDSKSKSKGRDSKKKDFNIIKNVNKRKNKTTSKDRKSKLNNIHINNIKNIHYININNIKTNILMKTCDSSHNKIKLYKKIAQISKNKKEGSSSNSKKKANKKMNTINVNKKPAYFKNYINFQHIKKNVNNTRTKKIIKEKKNRVKNNKTMNADSIRKNKDFNISLNNNDNKNNSIATDKNGLKKGIFLPKNFNNNRFIMNYKIKLKKTNNVNPEVKQLYLNQNKKNDLIKLKTHHNSNKQSLKDYDNFINIKNLKINNIKIERLPKTGHLYYDLRTSRAGQNRYIINSLSNSQSKSKSKTGGTRTSHSSNSKSKSKSKSKSIRDRIKKECFFAFKSSRNNYSKSKSGNKHIEKKFANLTQEQLSNLKCIKSTTLKGKEKYKQFEFNKNLMNKKTNIKGSINSKSKKNVLLKPKNINNYYYKMQNFKTSKDHHRLRKKIKHNNYMNILINDINNNFIQRHNTNILDNKNTNDNSSNINVSQKHINSLNFGLVKKDNLKINKDEFSILQKMKRSEKNMKDNIIVNKQKNIQKVNLNKIKKNIKEKFNFHSLNNYNKFKEYNKYSIFNNTSNIQDELSQEFYYDSTNLKVPSKNKINKLINNSKINKSNKKKFSKKKIKIGDLKSLQIKNLKIYHDIKPQTYRKERKFIDELIFNNDAKLKDNNNLIHPIVNYSNYSNQTGNYKK